MNNTRTHTHQRAYALDLDKYQESPAKEAAQELKKINQFIFEGNLDEAFNKVEALVEEVEKLDIPEQKPVFLEPLEEITAHVYCPEKLDLEDTFPLFLIYYTYGSLLFDRKDYKEASKILKKAVELSPTNVMANIEYIESLKALGEFEKVIEESKRALPLAIRKADLAHLYRDISFALAELGEWKDAHTVLVYSYIIDQDDSKFYDEAAYLITEGLKRGINVTDTESEPIVEVFQKREIPVISPEKFVEHLMESAQIAIEKNDFENTIYLLELAAEYGNPRAKELLEQVLRTGGEE